MASIDAYWASVAGKAGTIRPATAELSLNELRSTDFSDLYDARVQGAAGEKFFAYYSVPHGKGPFPAILQTPGYGSVVHVPPHERRQKFAVLAPCVRGQRLSDGRYAAEFPGLLTDGVEDPAAYRFRGIVSDCVAAYDFLASRDEVDGARIGIASGPGCGDLALLVAALRPGAAAVLVNSPLLFHQAAERFPLTSDYPLEEFNDYLRANPSHGPGLRQTLSLFDPAALAARVSARVRISCSESDRLSVMPLAAALGGQSEINVASGRGYLDHRGDEEWLATALNAV